MTEKESVNSAFLLKSTSSHSNNKTAKICSRVKNIFSAVHKSKTSSLVSIMYFTVLKGKKSDQCFGKFTGPVGSSMANKLWLFPSHSPVIGCVISLLQPFCPDLKSKP